MRLFQLVDHNVHEISEWHEKFEKLIEKFKEVREKVKSDNQTKPPIYKQSKRTSQY